MGPWNGIHEACSPIAIATATATATATAARLVALHRAALVVVSQEKSQSSYKPMDASASVDVDVVLVLVVMVVVVVRAAIVDEEGGGGALDDLTYSCETTAGHDIIMRAPPSDARPGHTVVDIPPPLLDAPHDITPLPYRHHRHRCSSVRDGRRPSRLLRCINSVAGARRFC